MVAGRSALSEKMRVHILAKELNVPSKTIIAKCRAEGIDSVKNHMSTLSAGLHATIREWFTEGTHDSALETTAPVDLEKVRLKSRPRKKKAGGSGETGTAVAEREAPTPRIPRVRETEVEVEAPADEPAAAPAGPVEIQAPDRAPESIAAPAAEAAREETVQAPAEVIETPLETAAEEAAEEQPAPAAPVEAVTPSPIPVKPVGPQHVPTPARIQGPRVVRYEAPDYNAPRTGPPPASRRKGPVESDWTAEAAAKPEETEAREKRPHDEAAKEGSPAGRRRARLNPRRVAGRLAEAGERLAEWRDRDLAERKQRLAGATGRRMVRRRAQQTQPGRHGQAQMAPITTATVNEPVRMKEFCSATGVNFLQVFKVLRDEHGVVGNVNMILPTDTAEFLALHFGIELNVVAARTILDDIEDEFTNRPREHPQPRPPVVTMLGHVDHGKTSLLDAVRTTDIAAAEDGGITQHIGAYHVRTSQGDVTFLDTPGHAAFTAMRARGARMTDVVVLVVAADDGVMPQTIEAINHARAAKVPIVVALNKIDLGEQNKIKIFGQLAERDLTPAGEWGGEVDVIPTSATTGAGVNELVEHLAALTSVLDLKADHTVPTSGTVIEAETKTGVGAVVRVLVQEGTLRVGDFVACGGAAGKVRALLNDRGQRIEEAGPSIPVEVWGLDDVPMAGDRLYQVETAQRAKDIASETKRTRMEAGRRLTRKARSLQEMLQQRDADETPELNLIIRADVDGSVAAINQALSDLPTDEVKLTVRHSGVGSVNDSDVLLAATCRGIVVAFRVDVSTETRRLAENHGVDIRFYRVIYDVCDEIKKALEGLLAPAESVEMRGTAQVREVFRLSRKAGVVAGSMVTEGSIDRRHRAKVIRDGVVVREGASLASLRRFKDDVREVKAGLECGIRLENFDDLHVGDVIQTYEIVKSARTL